MKTMRIVLCLLIIGFLSGCSGDVTKSGSNNTSTVIGSETSADGKIKLQKLEGSEIVISNASSDQQNPHVIYLPDKDLWFSVYEDYSNSLTTGADIKGKFIKSDGTLCGSELTITNASGNQTAPLASYRNGVGLADTTDTILVAWQDTRGTTNSGYVYHKAINVSSIDTNNCTGYSIGGENAVSYTQIKENDVTVSSSTTTTTTSKSLGFGDGSKKDFSGTLTTPVVSGSVTVTDGTVTLTDNGSGGLTGGVNGYGIINYDTGALSVTFAAAPAFGTLVSASYQYTTTTFTIIPSLPSVGDTLLSRKSPRVAYDPVRDSFWIVWNESRSTLNRISELCFGFAPFAWEFGDTSFPGYVALDGSTFAELSSKIGVSGADIIRNGINETRTNRLITNSFAPLTETYTYEFFTNANNITAASDTTSPEDFMVWEGARQKGVLECKCTDNNSNKVCDLGDSVTSTFATSNYDDGLVHIYGLFDKEISQGSLFSKKLDASTSNTYYPSVAFDPITKKFLVAWEDLRDGSNTKLYGQLVYSGGGLYNENILISYQDTDGDGTQDTNIANSKQTKPFISYDSVNQRYFVIWQDGRNGSVSLENLDIYGQYVDAEGSLRGSNYSISIAPANQYNPTIAYNSQNNQFLAVWKDARNYATTASDVYGQRFSLGMPQLTLLNLDNTFFSPPLLNFGTVISGQYTTMSFKVRNTGDASLKIDCLTSLSSPFSHESLPSELQTCEGTYASGTYLELVPSAELTFTVRFEPSAQGTFTSSFTIQSTGENKTVNLQGVGVQPDITVSSSTLSFGNIAVGQSADLPLTITNNGTVSYQITNITGVSAPFSIVTSPSYPYTLNAGQSLSLTIRFTPTQVTGSAGQMNIQTNISGLSATIALSGTGTGTPVLSVTPTSLNFGSVTVDTTSDKTVTLSNTGTATLTVNSMSITGTGFSLVSPPTTPFSIGAGGSQTITVRFSPTSETSYTGTLSVQSDGGNPNVNLVGQGVSTGGGGGGAGGGGSMSSSGGGCSIGGHQNAPTAFADLAVMLMPLFVIIMLRIRHKKK